MNHIKIKGLIILMAMACTGLIVIPSQSYSNQNGKYKIASIEFKGNSVLEQLELLRAINIKIQDEVNPAKIEFAKAGIISIYQSQGYWKVSVSTQSTIVSDSFLNLNFLINEGPQFFVSTISVTGNHHLSDPLILREFGVRPDEPFSQTRVFEAYKNIMGSRYFENMDIEYSTMPAHRVAILLNVKENSTQYLKGGLGYGAESKERVSLGFENRNFFGQLRHLKLNATHSGFVTNPNKYRTTLIEAELNQPYLFNTNMNAASSLSREYKDGESFDSVTTAWRISAGQQITKSLFSSLNVQFKGTRVSNVIPEAVEDTNGFYNIVTVGPSFIYDTVKNPILPDEGWRFSGQLDQGVKFGIGDLEFSKIQLSAKHYTPVAKFATWIQSIQTGLIIPKTVRNPIPIQERFTLGGANTVRGYSERNLGPIDQSGRPLGGEAYAAVSTEMRNKIYKNIFSTVFIDAGQLWRRRSDSIWPVIELKRLDDLRYGTGAGLRINTPIAPVRIELGYKLNPPANVGTDFWSRTEIHFSIGDGF